MEPAAESASTGSAGRLVAVGDVHGCVDEVSEILDAVAPAAGDTIVFVGDYVDRGPSPRGVIQRLIELRDACRPKCVFLKGNHEDMFLDWLGEPGRHGDAFIMNGGRTTLESYGIGFSLRGAEGRAKLPEDHLAFLRALRLWHREGGFVFVHAGIDPLRNLEDQDDEDLLWIRDPFLRSRHSLQETIVFGHTPHREIVWHLPWKIGLDTGCVYGNRLSALDLTSGVLYEARRGARRVTTRDVRGDLATLKADRKGV